jgi:DNA-binding HxlR family transcriptional regulator/putative sterol carrier protein
MTTRSYDQYCGLAYALDRVGERWTLLIIRELFAGPRRFKDLMEGLPGVSTNLLTERLKSLEAQGLLTRHTLPPPAGSTVYELTPLARGLNQTLIELGRWGSQFVPPSWEEGGLLRLSSYALTHKTFFRPHLAQGVHDSYEIHVDGEVLHVQIDDGEMAVQQGPAARPDLVIHATMPAYIRLLSGQLAPEQAAAEGLACLEGDAAVVRRFLNLCGLPGAWECPLA